jgi:hypothetical protein
MLNVQNMMRRRKPAGSDSGAMQSPDSIAHQGETFQTAAELGQTWITLPLGGAASNIPEAVREPKILTFGLLAAIAGIGFAAFVLLRLLLW